MSVLYGIKENEILWTLHALDVSILKGEKKTNMKYWDLFWFLILLNRTTWTGFNEKHHFLTKTLEKYSYKVWKYSEPANTNTGIVMNYWFLRFLPDERCFSAYRSVRFIRFEFGRAYEIRRCVRDRGKRVHIDD